MIVQTRFQNPDWQSTCMWLWLFNPDFRFQISNQYQHAYQYWRWLSTQDTTRPHAFGGTGFFQMPRHHSHFGSLQKRCDASPTYTRHHKTQHKTKQCVSTPIPLSARRGRLTTRRRIWHASRTRRSVSNIIGSVPNGKRRWDGVRLTKETPRFTGRMPVRLDAKKPKPSSRRARAPSSGPRAGLESLKDSSSPPPGASRSP